ncbi:MAG: hypothetical protein ABL952_17955, partial [Pyrinomonadaceae bacterium]
MGRIVLKNGMMVGDGEILSIVVDAGIITRVCVAGVDGEVIACSGNWLQPGFIDVHNHGAVGVDVNTAGVDGLLKIAAFLGRNGVTAWVPTLVPDSDD